MSYPVFEHTLAKLLTDEGYLNKYIQNSEHVLSHLDLTMDEKIALKEMNVDQLSVAAASFRKKRACAHKQTIAQTLLQRLTFRSNRS